MNRVTFYILATLLLSTVGCKSTTEKEDKGLALRKSTPIQLFMGTCVVGRQSSKALEQLANREGFVIAPEQIAQNYLKGNAGKAWHLNNDDGDFGLVLLENRLCSVFIHQGEPKTIQASMEAWLPPKNSGFTYKKELVSQSGSLTTTSYTLYQGNSFLEQWVITVNNAKPSNLVAIMSYRGA
ncbi:NMCC_0638 family (lipo)protein [Pseudoalteromonas sp. SS15]|uniref:NMCC_0638 family (lipo)protein n=1 Tax=Pseudoalteromonas sp. SS15 TaxID=3139393 RepID=UPI003BAA9CA9